MRLLEAIETNNETNNVSEHNMIQQAVAYFYAVAEVLSSGLLKTTRCCQVKVGLKPAITGFQV